MSRIEVETEASDALAANAGALAAPDSADAIRNAAAVWAEGSTRPETLARAEKLRDKVSAVTSFFAFAGKHPGEVAPEDVSRWRALMEGRGLKPATVYARISRLSAFYRWLMADPRLSRFVRSNPPPAPLPERVHEGALRRGNELPARRGQGAGRLGLGRRQA